jgi:hypothetical protein
MKQEGDTIDVRQNLDDNTVCNIKVCDDKNNTFMFHLKANQQKYQIVEILVIS